MANAQEAVERVSDFLADRMSLEEFEDWSASYVQSVHRVGDAQAQTVAHLIRSILNTYEEDQTEKALRQELADAIVPFLPFAEAPVAENHYGNPSITPGFNAAVATNVAA